MPTQEQEKHLQDLSEIRSMMERSSRFISLSGLSGVFVGTFALIGAAAAYYYAGAGNTLIPRYYDFEKDALGITHFSRHYFYLLDAVLVLGASLITASLLTIRQARKKGQKIWDHSARRLFANMMIPLAAGGIFALVLLGHGYVGLVAPVTLLFYGLALVNASKYTLDDIRYLGICEIILGLIASYYVGYGLLFWAIGFGVLHIVYGIVMYRKYER
jgi:general stress protein CsbA